MNASFPCFVYLGCVWGGVSGVCVSVVCMCVFTCGVCLYMWCVSVVCMWGGVWRVFECVYMWCVYVWGGEGYLCLYVVCVCDVCVSVVFMWERVWGY